MHLKVDLNRCQNQGQCAFAAPGLFQLDEDGQLGLRHQATERYVTLEIDPESEEEAVEASELCPTQSIEVFS